MAYAFKVIDNSVLMETARQLDQTSKKSAQQHSAMRTSSNSSR